jgi:hypothetical protein
MGSMINLPSGDSSTLRLVHPTEEEKQIQFNLNGTEWRGALSLPDYLRREETLSQQPLTRDGGITYWALVDTALKGNPFDPASSTRLPLASCETYRKKALVWKDGELHESVCHGIGSVFCASHLRKRGYAQRMMRELCEALKTYQAEEGKENLFSVLYSDIGKVSITVDIYCQLLTTAEILQHVWLGAVQLVSHCRSSGQRQRRGCSSRYPRALRGGSGGAMRD